MWQPIVACGSQAWLCGSQAWLVAANVIPRSAPRGGPRGGARVVPGVGALCASPTRVQREPHAGATTWSHVVEYVGPRGGPRGGGALCASPIGARRDSHAGTSTWDHVVDHVVPRGGSRGAPRGRALRACRAQPRGTHARAARCPEGPTRMRHNVGPRGGPRGTTWWTTWCTTWWTTWSGPLKTGHARAKRVTIMSCGTPNEQDRFRRGSLRRNLLAQLLHAKVDADNWLVAAKRS